MSKSSVCVCTLFVGVEVCGSGQIHAMAEKPSCVVFGRETLGCLDRTRTDDCVYTFHIRKTQWKNGDDVNGRRRNGNDGRNRARPRCSTDTVGTVSRKRR